MVSRKNVFISSFLLCISICFEVGNSQSALAVSCSDDTQYDVNTSSGREYRENLATLLYSLAINAYQPSGFFNDVNGNGQARVYGLFLCRGDVGPDDCQACLKTATTEVLQMCPNQTTAIIWYDSCMVRFSNRSLLSQLEDRASYDVAWYLLTLRNVSNAPLLNQVLGDTFNETAKRAAHSNLSEKKFAVQDANYTAFEKIHTLVQCTPDLSNQDCEICLNSAISLLPQCCESRIGGRVLLPSCNIRYESYPFYELPDPPPQQPVPSLPPPPGPNLTPPATNQGAANGR